MNGLELIPKIIEVHREAAVLVLTEHESRQACSEAFTSGARGLVFKSDKLRDVIRGVHALTRGKHFCSPRVNELLKAQPGHSVESGTPAGPLTSREQQILRLLAEGKTNKDVAVALDLSVRTVEAHRASLMRKLNLHSLSDLIYFAIRYQIVKI
jgi:DNA-binding NarL/FixJ family response regulator